MINKLRKKFILVSLVSVTAVLLVIVGTIFAFNYSNVVERADTLADMLSTNSGRFPPAEHLRGNRPDFTPETPYETRFFSVRLDTEGNVIGTNALSIRRADSEDIKKYAESVVGKGERGFIDSYRFKKTVKESETLIVFVDCTRDLNMFRKFVISGSLVSLLGLLLVFLLVLLLSKVAIAPAEDAMARQKRFITDASHELKTPLTVIETNLEVIELENGESKWSENARAQIARLRDLCNGLVELTRIDEGVGALQRETFDLTESVLSCALSFEPAVNSQGRRLVTETETVMVNGDKKALTRLVAIIMDNAVKYSKGSGDILLKIKKAGGRALVELVNPSDVPAGDHSEFFERFWREDLSRSETKGFGIGLSSANAIAEAHGGRISAVSDGKFLTVMFIF